MIAACGAAGCVLSLLCYMTVPPVIRCSCALRVRQTSCVPGCTLHESQGLHEVFFLFTGVEQHHPNFICAPRLHTDLTSSELPHVVCAPSSQAKEH